jgi:hypothetical protein
VEEGLIKMEESKEHKQSAQYRKMHRELLNKKQKNYYKKNKEYYIKKSTDRYNVDSEKINKRRRELYNEKLIKSGKTLLQPITIEDMQKIAESHGGKCLSKIYVNSLALLKWECSKKHIWKASAHNVKNRNQWCAKCGAVKANKNRLLNIKDLDKIAKQKGGRCLSRQHEYTSCDKSKLKWSCKYGHVWYATAGAIKHSNTWCPICNINYREALTKTIIEQLTGKVFTKIRPSWLVNKNTNYRLELDGFNEELMLAFEYNGIQHYTSKGFFHSDNESLINQKDRDKQKQKLCLKNNVKLIIIPYIIKDNDFVDFIKNKLIKNNICIINNNICIDDIKIHAYTKHENFKALVESIGYTLMTAYKGSNDKVKIKCNNGHVWEVQPRAVKAGNRCPFCSGKVKYNIQNIIMTANNNGLECLESKYINNTVWMKFKCLKCGTECKATSTMIMNNFKHC